MKIATIVVRLLLGGLFTVFSVMFFLKLVPEQESTGDFKAFQVGLVASEYLLPLVKALELLCGISFLTGKYVTLANIIILPVSLNILLVNYFLIPEGLPVAILIALCNVFLIYRYWDNYKSVFTP